MALSLVLADGHRIVRQGLRALLATEPAVRVVGEADDGLEALRLVERLRPEVLVLDLTLPRLDGLEVTRRVTGRSSPTRVIVLSAHSDEAHVAEALRAGAVGYVLKHSGVEELMQAVRAAAAGRRFLCPSISKQAINLYVQKTTDIPDPFDTLTNREREVLQLTTEGNSGAAIARLLFISPRTVESHRANLMRKLGVRNQKDLVRYAAQRAIPPAGFGEPAKAQVNEDGRGRTRKRNP